MEVCSLASKREGLKDGLRSARFFGATGKVNDFLAMHGLVCVGSIQWTSPAPSLCVFLIICSCPDKPSLLELFWP